mmetsp:Transcript_2225/g.6481  ORF Transcript_2225/g.6481 Transcript_2225/m.6481 type:complete len:372 (+) Transcript_2225:1717-2832(+)
MIFGGSATTPAIALEALEQYLGHIALFLGEESLLDGNGQEKFLASGLLALGKVIILLPLEDIVHQGREIAHELVDLFLGCLGQFLLLGLFFLFILFLLFLLFFLIRVLLLLRRLVDVHIIALVLLGGLFCVTIFGCWLGIPIVAFTVAGISILGCIFLCSGLLLPASASARTSFPALHSVGQLIELLHHNVGSNKIGHYLLPEERIVHIDTCRLGISGELALRHIHSSLVEPGGRLGSFNDASSSALGKDAFNVIGTELLTSLVIVVEQSIGTLLQELFHLLCRGLAVVIFSPKGTKNGLLQTELLARSIEHLLLEGTAGNEAVDPNILRLADTMASSLGLDVILRVPIRIEDDTDIGGSQVDADTSSSRR